MKKIVVAIMLISIGVPFPVIELEAEVKTLKTFEAGDLIRAAEINENFLILQEAFEQLDTRLQENITDIEAKTRTLTLLEQENQALKEDVRRLKASIEAIPHKETIAQFEKLLQEKIADIEAKTRSLDLFERENQALQNERVAECTLARIHDRK